MEITGETSDGFHTFNELYEFRMLLNATLFNEFYYSGSLAVAKSKRHSDGTIPFNDPNWFIVVATLPTGQISFHYQIEHWDLFDIPEWSIMPIPYDGHTSADVIQRLRKFLER